MGREQTQSAETEAARRSGRLDSLATGPQRADATLSQAAILFSLQRAVGNRAVGHVLQRLREQSVQRVNTDGTDYTDAEKKAAIKHARDTLKKPDPKAAAKAMVTYLMANCGGRAKNYKTPAALNTACKEWWNLPSQFDEPPPAAAERETLDDVALEYDAKHGDLHFIATPNDKKSAWSQLLKKEDANELVENEIRRHLRALSAHSAGHEQNGWSPFYITARHNKPVGTYLGPMKKGKYPTTDHFTIQLAINYSGKIINYHGYPDERIEGHPLGCSIDKTDKTKLS